MATIFSKISTSLQAFIEKQQLFFVATADVDGRVNVSPKGLDSLRVLSPNQVIWLNYTGSGNETAAHLLGVNRMTLMFNAFEGKPLILRLYGKARTIHTSDQDWDTYYKHFPESPGARQIFDLTVESVQTSCGYAVPLYEYKEQRTRLIDWGKTKDKDDLSDYWQQRNKVSIDGKPTGF